MAKLLPLPAACLACTFAAAALAEGDSEPVQRQSVFPVAWDEDTRSPGVCAGAPNWFLSVVPSTVSIDSLAQPIIVAGEETIPARILHIDSIHRLCLLEAEREVADASPFAIAPTAEIKAGASLFCLASGESCRTTLAGKDRVYFGQPLHQPLLRIRVEEAEKFCCPGTPLLDAQGRLVGILTARKLHAEGEAHAIPSPQLRKLISDFQMHQRSGLVWIGLVFHDLSTTPEVIEVRPDSPASRAGLERGDIVLEIGGAEVKHIDALTEAVYGLPAGRETSIKVLRELEALDLSLVPEFATEHAAAPTLDP